MTPTEKYLLARIEELAAAKAVAMHCNLKLAQARIRVLESVPPTTGTVAEPGIVPREAGYVVYTGDHMIAWLPGHAVALSYTAAMNIPHRITAVAHMNKNRFDVETSERLHAFYYQWQ